MSTPETPMPTTAWWHDRMEVASEVTLVGLAVAAVFSLGRLFTGTEHVLPLLSIALLAHVVLMLIRRSGRSLVAAMIVTPVAAAVSIGLTFHPGSTVLGIPTPSSVDLLRSDLDTAFSLFGEAPTPTEPLTGFLVLGAAALWISAFVADWAAFRLRLPTEALLPSGTIFVFAAVLADDHQRTLVSMLAMTCALAFFLVHRVARLEQRGQWLAGTSARGSAALVGTGSVILAAVVLAATLSGPSLPGAGAAPLVELEPNSNAPGSRVTVSPLVDIRRRLVAQADVEVFTVETDTRSYWRLTALDAFDGRIWSSSGSYGRAEGTLDRRDDAGADRVEVSTQTFDVKALAAIWLPAAFEPRSIDAALDLRYDEASSTLIVDTDILDSDGVAYTVDSDLPSHEPQTLAAASGQYPDEIIETQLDLPSDFPESVRQLATDVAFGGRPPPDTYTQARRLQEFLRTFRYDLSVPSGHGDDDLERFLFDDRAGYCEQFAGSFAAMARSLGIPARVAVGFTPGIEVEPGVFSVRGEHAHAWPEVYFAGIGWVPFEPTPGRGAPRAESYTGVAEQQVQSGGDPNTASTLPTATTSPDTDVTQRGDDAAVDAASPEPGAAAPGSTGSRDASSSDPLGNWLIVLATGFGVVLLAAVGYVVLALALGSLRRARRRRAAETPTERVRLAWDLSLERLRLLGLRDEPTATHRETTDRAMAVVPAAAEHARTVGFIAERAVYGGGEIGDVDVAEAEHAAEEIDAIVRSVTTATARSRSLLRPKTVFGVGPIRRIGGE